MDDVAETINTIFLVDAEDHLEAAIPVGRLFLHDAATVLETLISETKISVPVDETQDRVVELFDKYNLLALPVLDKEEKLAGVIHVDDIVTVLRQK